MGLANDLANAVMKKGDARSAISKLVERYPASEDSRKAYGVWQRVRYLLLHDNANRRPDFNSDVLNSFKDIQLSMEDFEKIGDLLALPLHKQHNILTGKRLYLSDKDHDARLKEIKPLLAPFYEFVLPEDRVRLSFQHNRQRLKDRQMHKAQDKDFYNFTTGYVDAIYQRAENVPCHTIIRRPGDYDDVFS